MKLKSVIIAKRDKYRISKLYIDNVYFCDVLEDTDRGLKQSMSLSEIKKLKKAGITAIPTGTYKITLDVVSPKYGNREPYKSVCAGKVPRLLNVPGFEGILIHIGNYPKDTDGCLLLGKNTVKGAVMESTVTWSAFMNKIKGQKDLTIEIIDGTTIH